MTTSENPISWSWLANTYWYVPATYLPAQRFDSDSNTLTWQVDQTVWHLSGERHGYVWGVTSALLYSAGGEVPSRGPGSNPSHFTLLGTVTPTGQVQLTFVPSGGQGAATLGFGQLVERADGWAFEMQMSTGHLGSQTLHWANMIETREGEPSWNQLPGLPYSVPEMLADASYPTVAPDHFA